MIGPQDETAEQLKLVAIGEQGLEMLKKTFGVHMDIARGLDVGREIAMSASGTDDPTDRSYQVAYTRWLDHHPKYRVFKKSYRHWAARCLDYEAEILAWRASKDVEQANFHYPETVFKRWAKAERPDLLTAKQATEKRKKPDEDVTQLHAELEASKAHIAELETTITQLEDASAALLNIEHEPAENIAERLIASPRWPEIAKILHRFFDDAAADPEAAPLPAPAGGREFGQMVRDGRTARGLSQRQLGEATGIDQATLSRVERGGRPPTPDQARVLSAYLGL